MSTKITLGKPPKTFAPVAVSFTMPDGTDGVIECVFKYRSRKQFGAFAAEAVSGANAAAAGEGLGFSDVQAVAVDRVGAALFSMLDSWSLDDKLTEESAVQLADELPAAATAIMEAFGRAAREGRLGN